jgi:uncharacterized membrane protein
MTCLTQGYNPPVVTAAGSLKLYLLIIAINYISDFVGSTSTVNINMLNFIEN